MSRAARLTVGGIGDYVSARVVGDEARSIGLGPGLGWVRGWDYERERLVVADGRAEPGRLSRTLYCTGGLGAVMLRAIEGRVPGCVSSRSLLVREMARR